jgi:formate dehydrogenase subunit delta
MNIDRLVRMANDIGDYFRAEPDREEAVNGILGHLSRFWEERMQAQIVLHLEQGGEGLEPLSAEAVRRLAAKRGQFT